MKIFMFFLGVGAFKSPRVKTQKRIVVNTWPFTEVCFLLSDWLSISNRDFYENSRNENSPIWLMYNCNIIRPMLLLGMF